MKKIKFPLEMAGGKMVRELEEFQEAFDLEKAVEYFSNRKLHKWLENNYNDDILEELEELNGKEEDFIERFTEILGVSYEGGKNVQELLEQAELKEHLKRQFPEEELERILPITAGNQNAMERLMKEGKKEIYLFGDTFQLPKDVYDITFYGIQNPKMIIEADNITSFRAQNVKLSGFIAADEKTEKMLSNEWNGLISELLDALEMGWLEKEGI